MADPIDNLRRKEQQEFTDILNAAERQMPKAQPAPPPVEAPTQPIVPEREPTPEPQNVQQLVDPSEALTGLTLPAAPVDGGTVVAPGQTPNEVIGNAVRPQLELDLQGQAVAKAVGDAQVLAADQLDLMPYVYQPPKPEQALERFSGFSEWALADTNRRIVEARANGDRQAQANAEWSRQALEFLRTKEGQQGSTGNPFQWVLDALPKDIGNRQYIDIYNKERGFNLPAALLYGLGVAQNTAYGAGIDFRNFTSFLNNSLPPWARMDAQLNRLPDWARNGLRAADVTAANMVVNPIQRFVTGQQTTQTGLFEGMYRWMTTPQNRLNDGRSNTIEALRGAQYSFSDRTGNGIGIANNNGFRVGAPKGQPGFGFDVNPSVIAGFGLDLVAGNRVDRVVDTGRVLFAPIRGVYRAVRGTRGTPTPPPAAPQAAKPSGAPQPKPPPTPPVYQQQSLPFLPPKPQAVKPKKPVSLERQAFRDNQQAIAAFRKANQQEAKRVRAMQRAAAKAPEPVQLELKLESLPEIKTQAPTTPPRQAIALPEQQLSLDLGDIVQQARQAIRELPRTGNRALDAYLKARVVNQVLAQTDEGVRAASEQLDQTADIGRRFEPGMGEAAVPLPTKASVINNPPQLPTVPVPDQLYHGTRVVGHNLSATDPVVGAARSELGTGHYLTPDLEQARLGANAVVAENLPEVANREFGAPTVIQAGLQPNARLLDATTPSNGMLRVALAVAEDFPNLRGWQIFDRPMSLVEVLDNASRNLDETEALQFQRTISQTLREAGYDGAVAGRTVSVYNPTVINQGVTEALPEVAGVIPKLEARADLEAEAIADTGSEFSRAATADADMRLASQLDFEAKQLADEVQADTTNAAESAGLWDDPILKLTGSDPNAPRLMPTSDPQLNLPLVLRDKPGTPMVNLEPTPGMMLSRLSKDLDDIFQEGGLGSLEDSARRVEEYTLSQPPELLPDLRNAGELPDLQRLNVTLQTEPLPNYSRQVENSDGVRDPTPLGNEAAKTESTSRRINPSLVARRWWERAGEELGGTPVNLKDMGQDFNAVSPTSKAEAIVEASKAGDLVPFNVVRIEQINNRIAQLHNVDYSRISMRTAEKLDAELTRLTDELDELTKQSPCGL